MGYLLNKILAGLKIAAAHLLLASPSSPSPQLHGDQHPPVWVPVCALPVPVQQRVLWPVSVSNEARETLKQLPVNLNEEREGKNLIMSRQMAMWYPTPNLAMAAWWSLGSVWHQTGGQQVTKPCTATWHRCHGEDRLERFLFVMPRWWLGLGMGHGNVAHPHCCSDTGWLRSSSTSETH